MNGRWAVNLLVGVALVGCSAGGMVAPTRAGGNIAAPMSVSRTSVEALPSATPPATPTPPVTLLPAVTADVASPQTSGDLPREDEPEGEQAARLAESGRSLWADSAEALDAVLIDLGEQSARHADGPLAIVLLQRAGLLDESISPHALWLLDPLEAPQRLNALFPREIYEWRWIGPGLDAASLRAEGIFAGDLLYLAPHAVDSLGRYLLVTRVDEAGRVYSTTILDNGARIGETLLLGATGDDVEGNLPAWSAEVKGILRLHRRDYGGQSSVQAALNRVLNRGGSWQAVVQQVDGAESFSRDADERVHPASLIKVALAMLVVQQLQAVNADWTAALAGGPAQTGRSYDQLLHAMLVYSEETATDQLEQDLRARLSDEQIHQVLSGWGAPQTTLEPRRSTTHEMIRLWNALYSGTALGPQASQYLLAYLAEQTAGDSGRLWALASVLPAGAQIYNKRGSLTSPTIVADSGVVRLPDGRAYLFCLIGEADDWTSYENLDELIADFALVWYATLAND